MEDTSSSEETEKSDTTIWSAPEDLVATHGLKNKIELTWKGVKSAVRYYIYEAPTPYDRFTQIAETTSNTTNYVLQEKSGIAKYYKVTAVKKDGEESPFSIIAYGTTLANPVITYIAQDEENSDSASSVHWYMNNCNTNTYQNNVRYTINCFDPQGNNVAEKIHDGQSDYPSITFEDLTPNTDYSYQVTAYIVSHQNDTEISDKIDATTARRLRPNPPEKISATLGTSTSEIQISFELPTMVDVALGNGIYEPKPLYFKIYRRIATENATEADWQIIENKFFTENFKSQYTPSNPEQPYEPGMTVTYTDTKELKRGLMYEYKVQSYADETTREISSNQSFATTQGFLMAVPKFETLDYETTRDTKGTADESDDVYIHVKTNFNFKGQQSHYVGKVRDVYAIDGDYLVMVVSDRISAFDVVLPKGIPFKGQVLNQIAAKFLDATADILPNWKIAVPDPMVTVGHKCEPFKVEMVIRGYLSGHAWREYKAGKRTICGVEMPEGMVENQRFPEPIITPTTKADEGHDEDISKEDIIAQGLVSREDYEKLEAYTRAIFQRGTEIAAKMGLILVDTKYEFGKKDGVIYLMDEIHTPDSSRYFYAEGYEERLAAGEKQKQLSKEFVREWLMANGFQGQEGQQVPEMTDEIVASITDRYVELYENIVGEKFVKEESDDVAARIEKNVSECLASL